MFMTWTLVMKIIYQGLGLISSLWVGKLYPCAKHYHIFLRWLNPQFIVQYVWDRFSCKTIISLISQSGRCREFTATMWCVSRLNNSTQFVIRKSNVKWSRPNPILCGELRGFSSSVADVGFPGGTNYRGVAPTYYLALFLPKNAWKWKNLDWA